MGFFFLTEPLGSVYSLHFLWLLLLHSGSGWFQCEDMQQAGWFSLTSLLLAEPSRRHVLLRQPTQYVKYVTHNLFRAVTWCAAPHTCGALCFSVQWHWSWFTLGRNNHSVGFRQRRYGSLELSWLRGETCISSSANFKLHWPKFIWFPLHFH